MESRGTVVLYCQIQFACVQIRHTPLSGGYCGEVPPLPIPNREVKLTCADGTAMQCGRVGSRLLLSEASITKVVGAFLFSCGFYFLTLIIFYADCFFCHADFADDADSFSCFFLLPFYSSTLLLFYSFTFLPFFFLIKVKTFCYKVFKNFKKALIINRLLAYFDFFLYLCKR